MKRKALLAIALLVLIPIFVFTLTSCDLEELLNMGKPSSGTCQHEYGELIPEVSPTFFEDGTAAHYVCSTCGETFGEDKNPISTLTIPKHTPELSICLDGEPKAAFTVESSTADAITLTLRGLTVQAGQTVGICRTDNNSIVYEYTVKEKILSSVGAPIMGNIDPENGMIRSDSTSAVTLSLTKDNIEMRMDGYVHKGVVIEILNRHTAEPVKFPMKYVNYYGDPRVGAYVFGIFGSDSSTSIRIVDEDTGTVFGYDNISPSLKWEKWAYTRGENGEIDFGETVTEWWLAFNVGGDGKITLKKFNRPFGNVPTLVLGDEEIAMEKTSVAKDSDEYKYYTWPLNNGVFYNTNEWLTPLEGRDYLAYRSIVEIEDATGFYIKLGNEKVSWKLLSEVATTEDALEPTPGTILRVNSNIPLSKAGRYLIEYLPFCNIINIYEIPTEDDTGGSTEASGVVMYLDGAFIPLEKGEKENTYIYYGLLATKSTNIALYTPAYTPLPLTLSESTDKTAVHTITAVGATSAYFDKAGTFNLIYNAKTGELDVETVELRDTEESVTYLYFLGVIDYTNGNNTVMIDKDPANPKEYCAKGVSVAANSCVIIIVSGSDRSENTYSTLADTDESIAKNVSTLAMILKEGKYDIYFNTETKTIRIAVAE